MKISAKKKTLLEIVQVPPFNQYYLINHLKYERKIFKILKILNVSLSLPRREIRKDGERKVNKFV